MRNCQAYKKTTTFLDKIKIKELYLQTQKLYKQRDELQKQLDRTLGRRIKNKLNRMR